MNSTAKAGSRLVINGDRLNHHIHQLANIGRLPNGGVSRIAFTPEDIAARQQVQTWMLEAGMTVQIDAAGNIIGRYEGTCTEAAALATGSHIDTVPAAGPYDGCLGVLAGLEIVRSLQEQQIRLQHPIDVIVFTDEESSVLGSKAMVGELEPNPEYYRRRDGTPIEVCLERIGGDWAAIATAQRSVTDIATFVELHVEQGGLLETAQTQIGIVTGVVGQYRFRVDITGRPNHAGTTPMTQRQDALVAASQVVLAVNQIATEIPGDQVGTVGYLTVSPNATNTVPAHVDLRIDLRDLSQAHLEQLIEQLQQELATIARRTQTTIACQEVLHILPTLAHPRIMATLEHICTRSGLSHCRLPSRAGHDAQEMGRLFDMGMIFVPSRAGISHAPEEYTSPQACIQGTQVLLETLIELDRLYAVS